MCRAYKIHEIVNNFADDLLSNNSDTWLPPVMFQMSSDVSIDDFPPCLVSFT